jgi:hypothetical protein
MARVHEMKMPASGLTTEQRRALALPPFAPDAERTARRIR